MSSNPETEAPRPLKTSNASTKNPNASFDHHDAHQSARWMLVASACFAVMGASIQQASQYFSLVDIIFSRGLPAVLLIPCWLMLQNRIKCRQNQRVLSLKTPLIRLQWQRNGIGLLAMTLGFYATSHLPLATATTLIYMAPFYIATWLSLQSWLSRVDQRGQEKPPLPPQTLRWLAVLAGFAGTLLVLKPSFNSSLWLPIACGAVGAICSAAAYLQVRALGRAQEPEWRTVFYFSLGSCLLGSIGISLLEGFTWSRWAGSPTGTLLGLIGVGISGTFGQLALTRAFGRGSTWLSASLQYSTIAFSALIGWLLWRQPISLTTGLGIGMIILSGSAMSALTKPKASAVE